MADLEISHSSAQIPASWEEDIKQAARTAGIAQSALWAMTYMQLDKAVPHFLQVHDGEEVYLRLLLMERPYSSASFLKNVIRRLSGGSVSNWLQWQDGPAVYTNDLAKLREAFRILLVWVDNYARQNISHVQATPARGCSADLFILLGEAMQEFGYHSRLWATYLVNLELAKEELWASLKSSARKAVKKAQRLGLIVEHIQDQKMLQQDFLSPYKMFEQAAGRNPPPSNRTLALSKLDRNQYYHFYVARDSSGNVIGTLGMHIFNGTATEIASSMSPQAYAAKLPAQDLLHWEMMLAARRMGCHTFDLAGINPNPDDPKNSGIAQFKEKWGGQYKEYPMLSKQYSKGLLGFL